MPSIALNVPPGVIPEIVRVPSVPENNHAHAEHAQDYCHAAQREISNARNYTGSSKDGWRILSELSSADCDLVDAVIAAEKAAQLIIDLENYADFWRRLALKFIELTGKPYSVLFFPQSLL